MTDVLAVYNSWGPGYYDPRYNQDGINEPVLIPPIYGLADVPLETTRATARFRIGTPTSAVTQMGGQGKFFDPRIGVAVFYDNDLVTREAARALRLPGVARAPAPTADAFDPPLPRAAARSSTGAAQCSSATAGDATRDAPSALHAPTETGHGSDLRANAARPAGTARRRCARCSLTRRTSTTAARRRSRQWSPTTTRRSQLNLNADQMEDLVQYLNSL